MGAAEVSAVGALVLVAVVLDAADAAVTGIAVVDAASVATTLGGDTVESRLTGATWLASPLQAAAPAARAAPSPR
jgi:hypothetical protein